MYDTSAIALRVGYRRKGQRERLSLELRAELKASATGGTAVLIHLYQSKKIKKKKIWNALITSSQIKSNQEAKKLSLTRRSFINNLNVLYKDCHGNLLIYSSRTYSYSYSIKTYVKNLRPANALLRSRLRSQTDRLLAFRSADFATRWQNSAVVAPNPSPC